MCLGKKRLADQRAVRTYLNDYHHSRGRGRHGRPEWLRAYHCPLCGGWHLTKGKEK